MAKPIVYYEKLAGMEEIGSRGMRAHVIGVTEHHTLPRYELERGGNYVRTSQVIRHDTSNGDIETVNTLYKRKE